MKNIIQVFFLLLLGLATPICAEAQWVSRPTPTGIGFNRIHNRSRDTVVIAGSNTTAAWSTNQGNSWAWGNPGVTIVTSDTLSFVKHVGRDRVLGGYYRFDNGSWATTMYQNKVAGTTGLTGWGVINQYHIQDAYFFPYTQKGFAVGNVATVFNTTNEGVSWSQTPAPITYPLWRITFANTQVGYAVGYLSEIIKTTNGGLSWQSITTSTLYGNCRSVSFPTPLTGYVGTTMGLFKTTNGGASFTRIHTSPIQTAAFYTAQRGIVSFASGFSQMTSDGGATFNTPGPFLYDLSCDAQGYCYGISFQSVSFYNNPNPVVSVAETWSRHAEFYPKLLVPGQALNYYLPEGQPYDLQVTGLDGRLHLAQDQLPGGTGQLPLNLPAGMYLLRVSAGSHAYQQKLIIR